MAKKRYSLKGALVKGNISGDGTTMVAVGLVRNVTPPAQTRPSIDLTAMEDTTFVGDTGIEEESSFVFTALSDPSDTTDAALVTLYNSGDSVKWQLIVSYPGAHTLTAEFTGKVQKIEPQSGGGNDPLLVQVTILRTGAITWTYV